MIVSRNDPASAPTSVERLHRRRSRAWAMWLCLFLVSFLLGRGIFRESGLAADSTLAIAFSLLPLIPGVMTMRAFIRLFRDTDEMIREVLTEGLLFGFGTGVFLWGAVQLPEHVWLPKIGVDIVFAAMMAGFSIGIVRAQRRRK